MTTQVLTFTSPAMRERERLLAEIRRLAQACGMTWEQITAFACGKNGRWEDRPTDFLYGPLNILRAEIAEKESRAAAPPPRLAKIIPIAPANTPAPVAPPAPAPVNTSAANARAAHRRAMIAKIHIALPALYATLPGFSEDTYRYLLSERFGVESSADLTNAQLHELLLHLSRLGWEAKPKRQKADRPRAVARSGAARARLRGSPPQTSCAPADADRDARTAPRIKPPLAGHDAPALLYSDLSGLGRSYLMQKISALLSEKGTKEGRYVRWDYALAILKRQSGGVVKEWEDALPDQLRGVIAALHRDAKRKGRETG